MARPKVHKSTTRRENHGKPKIRNLEEESRSTQHDHNHGTTARRKNNGTPQRHQGVLRGSMRVGNVLGDRCSICNEPLYTALDKSGRKWCSNRECSSHRR